MPFPRTANRPAVAIGTLRINLGDMPGQAVARKMTYHMELLDADGQLVTTQGGDLRPHLTAGQINALNNFLDAMRAKASEALP